MANEITGLNCNGGSGSINVLTEMVDGNQRIKLLDKLWEEMKGMTAAIQQQTNILVRMNTGIDGDLYSTVGVNETVDKTSQAWTDFIKIINGDPNDPNDKGSNSSNQSNVFMDKLSQLLHGKNYSEITGTENNLTDILSKIITGKKAEDIAGTENNLSDTLSKIITGKKAEDIAGTENNLSDTLSKVVTGKKIADISGTENNLSDTLSKVVTGKKVEELSLGHNGDVDGAYDTSLNGRLQKTTELILGMMVGLYTEDEVKQKLTSTDINILSSVEENLGEITKGASFMKNKLRRNSNYVGGSTGDENLNTDHLVEIERAIKSIALGFVHADVNTELRLATAMKKSAPNYSPIFVNDLKSAYNKAAVDIIRTINDFDPTPEDDGTPASVSQLKG